METFDEACRAVAFTWNSANWSLRLQMICSFISAAIAIGVVLSLALTSMDTAIWCLGGFALGYLLYMAVGNYKKKV